MARGYAALGLFNPKNSINVGHVLRAAGAFGAAMVAATGERFRGFPTDTEAARRFLPLLFVDDLRTVIPHDCVPVAIELVEGAKPLTTFPHPPRAFYIFGPEDGSLGRAVTDWCRDTVYIPAGCLNLAACVNVVLYDRLVKRGGHDRDSGARPGRRSFRFTDEQTTAPSGGAEKG
jgi:tRNA(Leu) C34 or U34 (ribose-2'-O)-methylase TrmL